MLKTEVKSKTVLFCYLRVWNWSFDLFICMDDKADEILSGRISWNSRRSNLSFLDPSWKNKFDSVVFCFCLQKLWRTETSGLIYSKFKKKKKIVNQESYIWHNCPSKLREELSHSQIKLSKLVTKVLPCKKFSREFCKVKWKDSR